MLSLKVDGSCHKQKENKMSNKARKKDLELAVIGKETMAIFDKLAMADTPTDRERVVKIANSIRNVIKRIESTNHPSNLITLLMLEECFSQLSDWNITLRAKDQLAIDEQAEGNKNEL